MSSFLSSCGYQQSQSNSPSPKALLNEPDFTQQLSDIDSKRRSQGLTPLTQIIKEGRLTKEDNGTTPVVMEIPDSQYHAFDDNGKELPTPIHDAPRVEEYFIKQDQADKDKAEGSPSTTETKPANPSSPTPETEEEDFKTPKTPTPRPQRPSLAKPSTRIPPPASTTNPPPKKAESEDFETSQLPTPRPQTPAPKEEPLSPIISNSPFAPKHSLRPRIRPQQASEQEETKPQETSSEKDSVAEQEDPKKDQIEAEESASDLAPKQSLRPQLRPRNFTPSRSYRADWDDYSFASKYTNYVLQALESQGQSLLSQNFRVNDRGFCKNYNSLGRSQRKQFWLMMISSMSRHESGFDTNAKYLESGGEYSRGLMQLGLSSTRGYNCGFRSASELHTNPAKNLECTVRIINRWIERDRVIRGYATTDSRGRPRDWRGVARYWSVLRFEVWEGAKRRRLMSIKSNASRLSFCQ